MNIDVPNEYILDKYKIRTFILSNAKSFFVTKVDIKTFNFYFFFTLFVEIRCSV